MQTPLETMNYEIIWLDSYFKTQWGKNAPGACQGRASEGQA